MALAGFRRHQTGFRALEFEFSGWELLSVSYEGYEDRSFSNGKTQEKEIENCFSAAF